MKRGIETIAVDGFAVEFSVIGEGEPILVFHGGHSNCKEEFGYESLIENGYSIITPSRPGYGGTSKELGESLATACHYYYQLLNHLKISRVHVLAISAGGPTGIYFASKYPEMVQTLTLQSAVTKKWLTPQDMEYRIARVLFHPKIEEYTWKLLSIMNNLFPRFIFKQMLPSFSNLTYREAIGQIHWMDIEEIRLMNNRQRSGYGFFIDLEQINKISSVNLQSISCPTLVVHSKYDGSVPFDHAKFAHEHIPYSTLYPTDSWGHLIWLGKTSNEVNEKVVKFLRANGLKERM